MNTTPEIERAVEILKKGGLVAFPTETVYGLGADATNPSAIDRIFKAKERPFDHPLIVHLASKEQIKDWADEVPEAAFKLAHAFWPGPLTLILKKKPSVLDKVTGGQQTVGLRIPNHPVALSLLNAFGGGLAAPSANKFTHISPTTSGAVREELDKVDLILEGGACAVGLESTILDLSGYKPLILRPGMISAQEISSVLGEPVALRRQDTPTQKTPGMHHVHYAPLTKTVLIAPQKLIPFLQTLNEHDLPLALMTVSDISLPLPSGVKQIKMPNNATDYAHDLYCTLRLLDNQHFQKIVIEKVPEEAAWEAIRDRLLKASHSL